MFSKGGEIVGVKRSILKPKNVHGLIFLNKNHIKLKFIVFIYLTIIWLIGIIFSLPLLLNIYLGKSMDDTYTCELNIDETKQDIILILRFFLIFILPFSIILTSSVKLIIFLKKNSFSNRRRSNSNEKESNSKANSVHQKAIKIVLSIVFMFIVQWLPLWTGINYFFLLN